MMRADEAGTDDSHPDTFHVAPPCMKERRNEEAYSGGQRQRTIERARSTEIEPGSMKIIHATPMPDYAPRPEHKFSFGLWTVSNRGRESVR